MLTPWLCCLITLKPSLIVALHVVVTVNGAGGILLMRPVRHQREGCVYVCVSGQDVAAVNSQCANLLTATIMLPPLFGIPKGVGMAQHSRPGISSEPGIQLHAYLGSTGPHNTWITKFQFAEEPWSNGLWQLQGLRSSQAGARTHTPVGTFGLVTSVCYTVGRHRREGEGEGEDNVLQPQLLMSIPAANYCSSSSAAAEENSSPSSPLPSPLLSSPLIPASFLPLIHILWSESADLTSPPPDERWLPSCKGRGGRGRRGGHQRDG